ncbi:MAG TPA: DEAD/DEAH box helicase [Chloroflexi bacterium]|nr:DEAD/DEAH box helicase [Chloroflexota bacterium]
MALDDLLSTWRQEPHFMRSIAAWERLPARPAKTAPWPNGLHPHLVAALQDIGIERLYIHQAEAIAAAQAGQHWVLATATASGKTLAYNLPILDVLLGDPQACALYLFPTKALAHDQIAGLHTLLARLPPPGASLVVRPYDGDTPPSHRAAIRREARILVSNPDMLHTAILPHHTRWMRFFSQLRYVVLDELHTYRGIFGSHVANVLRRLQRICRFYGSAPRFLCASATIANPRELAERLIEVPVTLINCDGSPQGEKHFLLYTPPLVDPQLGLRKSILLSAQEIAARLLQADIQTIVFARSRLSTEIVLGYLRDTVTATGKDPEIVQGYRGGYLPHQRRSIERGLREGRVRAVVATNALELGVDIGALDACVIAGYPGSIASTWQQVGRAGRRANTSVAVLIASPSPLDQYLVHHPHYFFDQPVEQALLDPDNLAILPSHLACAAFELPIENGEPFGTREDLSTLLEILADEGVLHSHDNRFSWIGESYPAGQISLRTGTTNHIVIQDVGTDPPRVIGQLDRPSAPSLIHTGAIYLHAGETYRVESLEWETGIARVRADASDYYTRSIAVTDVTVVQIHATGIGKAGTTHKGYGDIVVTTAVTGYRKIKRYTHETLAWEPLTMPEQRWRTTGYWITLSAALTDRLEKMGILPPPLDYGPNWAAQRDAARARDAYRCQRCGRPESPERQHHVHHITPFRKFGYRPGVPGADELYIQANRLENLITLCPTCHRIVERMQGARGALSGLAYLLRGLAPLYVMCDPSDLGVTVQVKGEESGPPAIILYDQAPGGVGLSARLYELHDILLTAALDVVHTCPCTDGCPSCVGPSGEVEPGAKMLTSQLLELAIEANVNDQS